MSVTEVQGYIDGIGLLAAFDDATTVHRRANTVRYDTQCKACGVRLRWGEALCRRCTRQTLGAIRVVLAHALSGDI